MWNVTHDLFMYLKPDYFLLPSGPVKAISAQPLLVLETIFTNIPSLPGRLFNN